MKFFSKQKKIHPIAPHHEGIEAGGRLLRDWATILIVFVILVLTAFLVDGYLLIQINRGDFFSADAVSDSVSDSVSGSSPETLNRKTLLDAAGFFEARQKEYDAFRSIVAPQIDPSI